jgi:hypothetical protein
LGKSKGLIYLTFDLALLKSRRRKRKLLGAKVGSYKNAHTLDVNLLNELIITANVIAKITQEWTRKLFIYF